MINYLCVKKNYFNVVFNRVCGLTEDNVVRPQAKCPIIMLCYLSPQYVVETSHLIHYVQLVIWWEHTKKPVCFKKFLKVIQDGIAILLLHA